MWVVCWRLHGVEGVGNPVRIDLAFSWAKQMNKTYGPGTHWIAKHANVASTEV